MPDAIAKFFYGKTSMRVCKKWENEGKPPQECIVANRKLFSHVINCKLTDDNPYLLTPTSMAGIRKKLNFSDNTEVMFGDKREIEGYAEELFCLLFDEYIIPANDMIPAGTYQVFYCDYLPFAKNFVSLMLLSNESIKPDDLGIREALLGTTIQNLCEQRHPLTKKARHYIYLKNKDWFLKELFGFINKTTSYKHLPKITDAFAREIFVMEMIKSIPTSKTSLGIRVKEIFENDLAICDQEIRVANWLNKEEEYKYKLFKTSLDYVTDLEKIFMKYVK